MRIIEGNTINQTIYRAYDSIKAEGLHNGSRNGGATALYNTIFRINNPRSRHLQLDGRKSNIFQMMAETFWVMAGADRLDPYLSFFLPRAHNYSDDGERWHGAYGPRMYTNGQLQGVVDTFKTDGKFTRRAQVVIYDAAQDSPENIAREYGEGHKPKDIPCNSLIYFYVTPDNKFHTHLTQRSGDMLFGAGSINPFEFSFLQELMFNEVQKLYPEIELGHYSWYVNNAHVYDDFMGQVDAVLSSPQITADQNHQPLIGPAIDQWESFFGELIAQIGYSITVDVDDMAPLQDFFELSNLFQSYGVPTKDNLLFEYATLVQSYVYSKRMPTEINHNVKYIEFDEVKRAVLQSGFRKFNIIEA